MATRRSPAQFAIEPSAKRVPGRKPGHDQQEELLRIWGRVDDDGRKMMLFFARQLARDQGLVPVDTPLMITDRIF